VHFHSSLLEICSSQKVLNIFLRHLLIKTCNLAVIILEFFQTFTLLWYKCNLKQTYIKTESATK
jgi:hypothetical protein